MSSRPGDRPDRRATALTLILVTASWIASPALAQQTVGLFVNDTPQEGLTLFSPASSNTTFLINNDALLVHSWTSEYEVGGMAYLLENGDLLRGARGTDASFPDVEQFDWAGNLLWQFEYGDFIVHHDLEPLPNGNVLITAREIVSEAEAIAEGKNPALAAPEIWMDHIIEVEPTPPVGGIIVWEWHVRDHLIQDFDPTKGNFGPVQDHPERADFNYNSGFDFTHLNGVDYNEEFDQIVVSIREFDEIWVIDHSTTTAEAASSSGGTYGKGGDLLYRWGNPLAYRRGSAADHELWGQHDSNWVAPGYPGAGNIMIFNNGNGRPEGSYSSVEEIVPPVDANGFYPTLGPGEFYGPTDPIWTYVADPPESLYSGGRSGAERQLNGNTLICQASVGHFLEVQPDSTLVWDYVNPVGSSGAVNQGIVPFQNGVFKIRRYPPDYPGLVGRNLTPGDPVELFAPPFPATDGSLRATRITADGTTLDVEWDAFSCPSSDYNLIYGDLQNVATYELSGAECLIGTTRGHLWTDVPGTDLFFLVVGTDILGLYESSWGRDSAAAERYGTKASFQCGTTTKAVSSTCPYP